MIRIKGRDKARNALGRGVPALLLGLCGTLFATPAFAFCRVTTCDPTLEVCNYDDAHCPTTGTELAWTSSCVQVWVQADGSAKQHIDFDAAEASVTRAFAAWTNADCGQGAPSISVHVQGPITCRTSEFNRKQRNANIVMFRDDDWPYVGGEDALGLTRIRFSTVTGAILDSDIEVNAVSQPLSVGDPVQGADLDSLLTHEAGHLLGLGHTLTKDATMFPGYTPDSSGMRTLASDDIAGICSLYAPGRVPQSTSCTPTNGFSDACAAEQPPNDAVVPVSDEGTPTSKGCSFAPNRGGSSPLAVFGVIALAGWGARRRRRTLRNG